MPLDDKTLCAIGGFTTEQLEERRAYIRQHGQEIVARTSARLEKVERDRQRGALGLRKQLAEGGIPFSPLWAF